MASRLALACISVAAIFVAGCTHYNVLRQASPNPFLAPTVFAIEPVSYAGVMVQGKTEDAFKAERDMAENERWEADKRRVATTFADSLREATPTLAWGPPRGDVTILRVHVLEMHGGVSLGVSSTAAHIAVDVQLVRGGQIIDEISSEATASQGDTGSVGHVALSGYTGSDRLNRAADRLGGYVAQYLLARTAGTAKGVAQPDDAPPPPPSQPVAVVQPPPAAVAQVAPAPDAPAPAVAVVPDAPPPAAARPHPPVHGKGKKVSHALIATLPGFEMLPDGGSRVFVELTRNATVAEKRTPRLLTYVIRGAHVAVMNNEHALVTVHFNTPVERARIVPVHGDVVLTIELRADAPAAWRVVDGADGSVLQVDFPRGAFLAPGEYVPGSTVPGTSGTGTINVTPTP